MTHPAAAPVPEPTLSPAAPAPLNRPRRVASIVLAGVTIFFSAVAVVIQIAKPSIGLSDGTFGLPEWQVILLNSRIAWLVTGVVALILAAPSFEARTRARRVTIRLGVAAVISGVLSLCFPIVLMILSLFFAFGAF